MTVDRRIAALAALAGPMTFLAGCAVPIARPPAAEIAIYSAGAGSAFLPYAQGLAGYLAGRGAKVMAVESRGSIENLQRIDETPASGPRRLGTVFLGTAFEAVNGTGTWTGGRKHSHLRALFPMYETSFQIVALRASGHTTLSQLAGKRVGVGPAGGPAESFFKGLAEANGLQVQTVAGTPAALAADLRAGQIDALWQGAALPIPAIKDVTEATDATVFGLTEGEVAAMLGRFPFLSAASIAANLYRGQTQPIRSVAAWNFVMAHKDLPDDEAYFITRTVLSAADPKVMHPSAGPSRMANAPYNTVVPFHNGALRFYGEQGMHGLKKAP